MAENISGIAYDKRSTLGMKKYVDQADGQLQGQITTLETQIGAAFFFKGSSTYAELPSSGNTVNDTYYVTDNDKQCWYTWNGTDWVQSSMNQASYDGLIEQLKKDMSNLYDNTATYQVGDYCINDNDNKLYVCKTAIAVPESFDSAHWDAVAFSDAFGDMVLVQNEQPTTAANKIWFSENNVPDGVEVPTMDDIENIVAEEYDNTHTYAAGQYCIHDNLLYRCTTATELNEAWTSSHWTQIDVTSELEQIYETLYTPINDVQNLPITSDKIVDVTLNTEGKIYNGNGNFVDIFGITDGTYTTEFGVTVTVSNNSRTITLNGTANSSGYFRLSGTTGEVSNTNSLVNRSYDFPILPISLYSKIISGSITGSGTTLSIRKHEGSGNAYSVTLNKTTSDTTPNPASASITDDSNCGELYLYIPSGKVFTDYVMDIALGYSSGVDSITPDTDIINKVSTMVESKGVVTATVAGTGQEYKSKFNEIEDKPFKVYRIVPDTNKVSVYFPIGKNLYGKLDVFHSLDEETNLDYWRIGDPHESGKVYKSTDGVNFIDLNIDMLVSTENEFAINFSFTKKGNGESDDLTNFIGGWHGYENCTMNEEASTTSSHNYGVGDYFVLSDTLYIVTAGIASGDTITVDTNCAVATGTPRYVTFIVDGVEKTFEELTAQGAVNCQTFAYRVCSTIFAPVREPRTFLVPLLNHTKITEFIDGGFKTTNYAEMCYDSSVFPTGNETTPYGIWIHTAFTGLLCVAPPFAEWAIGDTGDKYQGTHPNQNAVLGADPISKFSRAVKMMNGSKTCEMDSKVLYSNIENYNPPPLNTHITDRKTDLKYYSYFTIRGGVTHQPLLFVEKGDFFATEATIKWHMVD